MYQHNRYSNQPFSYTISGLTANASYQVRLHFAETYWNAAGKRVFNVAINGTSVLSNFDIWAAAGAENKAVIRAASATANSSGQIVVALTSVTDSAQVNGIEVVPTSLTATPALSLTYDSAGNVVTYTDAGGTITYTYDADNELVDLAEPGGSCAISGGGYYSTTNVAPTSQYCTAFAYNADGARILTLYPGGAKLAVTPDNSGRALEIKGTYGSTTLTDEKYKYCTGNPTSCPTVSGATDTERTQSKTDLNGAVTAYTYDSLGRLKQAAQTVNSPQTWTYGYDADGNRTSETGAGTGTHTLGYNTDDELTSQDGSTTGWSYDANGNETAGLGTSTRTAETYSPTDQLTGLTAGGTVNSFTYTGLGNAGRISNTSGTSAATNYTSGQEGLASQTTGTATLVWTRDPSGTLIAQRNGTDHEYYLTDGQGSVLALVNTAGTINASYTYDPYGITTSSGTLATTNPYRYTGGYQDSTGLYHLNARYYDPALGRFTQLDPSGQSAGYVYGGNDPLDRTDPSGELPQKTQILSVAETDSLVGELTEAGDLAELFAPILAAVPYAGPLLDLVEQLGQVYLLKLITDLSIASEIAEARNSRAHALDGPNRVLFQYGFKHGILDIPYPFTHVENVFIGVYPN